MKVPFRKVFSQQSKVLLLFCFLVSAPVFAEEGGVVQAFPTRQIYHLSSQGGYACSSIYDAAHVVLNAIEARNVYFDCYYYGGAHLSFWSLKETASHPEAPSVPAVWVTQQITLFRDGYRCAEVAEWVDWFLDRVTVRNVTSSVFCNMNGGTLFYRFEALVPFAEEPDSYGDDIHS